MSRVIQCPGCKTRLKISASGGTQFRCPKCDKLLKIQAAAPTPPAQPTASSPSQPAASDPFAFDDVGNSPGVASPSFSAAPASSFSAAPGKAAKPKANQGGGDQWKPFAKKWLTIVGGICGFAIVLGILGFFVEIAGLFAAVTCMLLTIACIFGGRFWIAIMLGRKNTVEGLLAVFIPLVGLVWALQRKGELFRGAIMYGSSLIPCLLGLVFVALFNPNGATGSRARGAQNFDKIESRATADLQRLEALEKSDDVTTVKFKVYGLNQEKIDFSNGADAALRQWKHYEPGSFQYDRATGKGMLKHRGNDEVTRGYRFYLGGRFRVSLPVDLAS